jgi:DNA invertase Pin-like site-specific DNA recombinase/predicted metal-binding protein
MKTITEPIKYCLYARKSSESDEKQAMSIDGQLMEMREQAKRQKLLVIEEVTESHSAKATGQRPKFNYMLENISKGRYNSILTWAPDRISRNAGDLGRVIDLMDQGKIICINTHSQDFSNNPNEKFLLMILCSQAKLENDNRGINVKRGLKNKCSIGIKPGIAPVGYINTMKGNRIATVDFDPIRAPVIKEMFEKVAYQGYSGRMIRKWLRKSNFKTKNDLDLCLGIIYKTLKNPFYYGEFTYAGKVYKGSYEPLITKQVFDKVQIQLSTVPREWNKQLFPFKKIARCGGCGGSITAEVKYKYLKNGSVSSYIYYHCNRIKDYYCKEPYISETEMIKQVAELLPKLKLNKRLIWAEYEKEISRFTHLNNIITKNKAQKIELTPLRSEANHNVEQMLNEDEMIRDYLLHILQYGTPEERLSITKCVETKLELLQSKIIIR